MMNKQTTSGTWQAGQYAQLAMICGLLLAAASNAWADDHADARFRGTGKADPVRITNVAIKPSGSAGAADVTFDLAWDHSWRAAWEVSEEQHGGKGPLKLESWDAAWVFVKFRSPGADQHSHAMLSASKGDHRAPASAALDVGLTDDGTRGVGVFVYRKAAGHGPNDFKGVTLRWLHGAVDPAAVELKVYALEMVYVPQCAFWAGDGSTDRVKGQFSAGYSAHPFRVESERALTLGGETAETLNNRDAAGMDPSNRDDFNSDQPRTLPAEFPKGYKAFYCMKHEITQKQYVDFLNTLSYGEQAACTREGPNAAPGAFVLHNPSSTGTAERLRNEVRIAVSGVPDAAVPVRIPRGTFVASGTVPKRGAPAVYEAGLPHLACNYVTLKDGEVFAAWAGLRPMTELEFEKACRGPLLPVANEYAWGTDQIAGMDAKNGKYVLQNAGQPDETVVWEGDNGPDATRGNAPDFGRLGNWDGPLRVGVFATPTSDRVRAGASYWGILDLTGNLMETAVAVSYPEGRAFSGSHGDGGAAPWAGLYFGQRGGGFPRGAHPSLAHSTFRISNRFIAANPWYGGGVGARHFYRGFRCVRTAK